MAPGAKSSAVGTPAQPLWGMGSSQFGGRFTPRNSFETVYLAQDAMTAFIEVGAIIKQEQSLVTLRTHPWVLITIEGSLSYVLDLTDVRVVNLLGSNHQELTGEWRYTQEAAGEAPTQLLGRVCHSTGRFDGIPLSVQQEFPGRRLCRRFPGSLESPGFPRSV
jgi:RES domain-containing protein